MIASEGSDPRAAVSAEAPAHSTAGGLHGDATLDPWIARLMDEYKILQDKIDKIGGFRFTVKGWSVTLITGSLAAASAANNPGYVPLALILVVVTFFLLEYQQWEFSLRFGMRASEIEEA